MSKIEREIKILDVNVDEYKQKLNKIGAEYKGEKKQKIFVYDVPTIYYRYLEVRELLKSRNKLIVSTNMLKLKELLFEIDDLSKNKKEYKKVLGQFKLDSLNAITDFKTEDILKIIISDVFDKLVREYKVNPNKWIRLRTDNKKTTLTTKHVIVNDNSDKIQKVIESEIEVSSFEETNNLLNSIGIFRRSYQEKIRYSYTYKDAEIEIDIWPMLKPYVEIECDNGETIDELLEYLNVQSNKVVSMNTEQLYNKVGINIHEVSELRFDEEVEK